jgi:hypothetical protein
MDLTIKQPRTFSSWFKRTVPLNGHWSFSGCRTKTNVKQTLRFSSWLKTIDQPRWFDHWSCLLNFLWVPEKDPHPLAEEVWPLRPCGISTTNRPSLKQEANLCTMCSKLRCEASGILDAGWSEHAKIIFPRNNLDTFIYRGTLPSKRVLS